MIIRVTSSAGMKKFELADTANFSTLLETVASGFDISQNGSWYLTKNRSSTEKLKSSPRTKLTTLGLKHGDMLYLVELPSQNFPHPPGDFSTVEENDSGSRSQIGSSGRGSVIEDKIDQDLAKVDGQIRRKRNEQLCHHPPSGQCIHCVPLEPFDAEYLEHLNPPVKFMSFHAYLRKLSGGKGKFINLENLSYRVKPGCRDHPPWPDGICTKCQPNPVTLEIQPYRHVDFVQFENGQMVEAFLDYWRQTGRQRIGILFGRYAHFDTAGAPPLAIKAVVAAIYEPAQESTTKSIRLTGPLDSLLPDHVVEVAARLDLKPVGWIFTDLVAEDQPGKGTVKHYRGTMDTFFLSAEECVTAAHLQNLHPNICALSSDGRFGSKFVTVVVTGDSSNEIHFDAYQVSNQAMALERDQILVPTFDAPEFGYIRETTKEQFVPEVFYTLKDKYGNRVTKIARPLPVEYLLVDMPVAFPIEPLYTMAKIPDSIPRDVRFPIENRDSLGQTQDFNKFAAYLTAMRSHPLCVCLANFHLLCWLACNDTLPMNLRASDKDGLSGLLDALASAMRSGSNVLAAENAVSQWAASSSAWATVQELAKAASVDQSTPIGTSQAQRSDDSGSSAGAQPMSASPSSEADHWACQFCTFHNRVDSAACEMCGLPHQT